jgi:hypoxanthine phosphoribosyltransferase
MKCKLVTFDEVYTMVKKVAEMIKASGYKPDIIIGLTRGGWLPARLMCDFLGLTDLVGLKVEHWIQTGQTKDEATIKYPLEAKINEKRILVVDDITDTGKSLTTSTEYLKKFDPKEIRVAVMQYIPNSEYVPDYFAEKVKVWTWFIYPWNWIEDTSTLIIRLLKTKKDEVWNLDSIDTGLSEHFEIKWDKKNLLYILKEMEERKQLKIFGEAPNLKYKVEETKPVQL